MRIFSMTNNHMTRSCDFYSIKQGNLPYATSYNEKRRQIDYKRREIYYCCWESWWENRPERSSRILSASRDSSVWMTTRRQGRNDWRLQHQCKARIIHRSSLGKSGGGDRSDWHGSSDRHGSPVHCHAKTYQVQIPRRRQLVYFCFRRVAVRRHTPMVPAWWWD